MEPLQRPDLYVVVRLLDTVRTSERTLSRTQLQIASGMNYTQFERYLHLTVCRGLLALSDAGSEHPIVVLTPKGYDALMFLVRGLRDVVGSEFSTLP
ncbi:MAG TPA: hypothetical protein VMH38_07925 [Thermoplasmata archaeon]|nr:hypothetical protein [Thermoplasmata archaeon]